MRAEQSRSQHILLSRNSNNCGVLCPLLRAADPLGDGFPVRVVPGGELVAAVVELIAAGFGRKRMLQKVAAVWIARLDQHLDGFEILAGLLLGPGVASRRKALQAESVVALRVAHHATRVA